MEDYSGRTAAGSTDLTGRVALVTGASRGIGRGIAIELGRRGASVVINYRRDEEAALAVVGMLEKRGATALAVQASMSDPSDVEALADAALERFGAVDILVANAGIASRGLPVAETDRSEVLRVVDTHAFSAHRLCARLLPAMRKRPRGDIVFISSSELREMRANGAPYNMGKAALEALAYTLAKEEVANGIRVNVVAPGLVATDMGDRLVKAKLGVDSIAELDAAQPLGRVCRPEDIAEAVGFFVGDAARFVTGQRLVVDGGSDASPTG